MIRRAAALPAGDPDRRRILKIIQRQARIPSPHYYAGGEGGANYVLGIEVPDLDSLPRIKAVAINPDYGGFNLSKKAAILLSAILAERVDQYTFSDPKDKKYPRHHPALLWVIKTLGKAASPAKLEVVPIGGSKYRISEYDGAEWVETPSSIDWISL
jgi:hypothetical protein